MIWLLGGALIILIVTTVASEPHGGKELAVRVLMIAAVILSMMAASASAGAYGGVFNHARAYGSHRGYGYARKNGPTHAHPRPRDMRRTR